MPYNSLSILGEIDFNVTASKGSQKFNLAEAIKQFTWLALEFLFTDDGFAINLDS